MLHLLRKIAGKKAKPTVEGEIGLSELKSRFQSGRLLNKVLPLISFTYKPVSGSSETYNAEDIKLYYEHKYEGEDYALYSTPIMRQMVIDVIDAHFLEMLNLLGTISSDGSIIPPEDDAIVAVTAMLVRRYIEEADRGGSLNVNMLNDVFDRDHYKQKGVTGPRMTFNNNTTSQSRLIDQNRDRLNFFSQNVDIRRLNEMTNLKQLVEYFLEIQDKDSAIKLVTALDSKAPLLWLDRTNRPKLSLAYMLPVLQTIKLKGKKQDMGMALMLATQMISEELLRQDESEQENLIEKWNQEITDKLSAMQQEEELDETDITNKKNRAIQSWVNDRLSSLGEYSKNSTAIIQAWNKNPGQTEQRFRTAIAMAKNILAVKKTKSVGADVIPTKYTKDIGTSDEQQMDIPDKGTMGQAMEDAESKYIEELESKEQSLYLPAIIHSTVLGMKQVVGPIVEKRLKEVAITTIESPLRKSIENSVREIGKFKDKEEGVGRTEEVFTMQRPHEESVEVLSQGIVQGVITALKNSTQYIDDVAQSMDSSSESPFVSFGGKVVRSIVEHLKGEDVSPKAIPNIMNILNDVLLAPIIKEMSKKVLLSSEYAIDLANGTLQALRDEEGEALRQIMNSGDPETKKALGSKLSKKIVTALSSALTTVLKENPPKQLLVKLNDAILRVLLSD